MEKGQTLLEVIIATAIIVIGLVPLLSLVVQSMSVGQQSKERTQATFLAQESIELIQNIRDSNFKNKRYWRDNFNWPGDSGFSHPDGFYFTYNQDQRELNSLGAVKVSDGTINKLDNTNFYRYININNYQGSNEKLEIKVEVVWPETTDYKGRVVISSVITKWLPNEN